MTFLGVVGGDWPLLLFLGVVLSLEAFFSGSEMALISADRLQLRKLANSGNAGAKAALRLVAHPERMLSTVLIGTTLCIITEGTVTTVYMHHKYGGESDVVSVLILAPLVLIFGELLPKTLFQRFSTQAAPLVSLPVSFFQVLLTPVIFIITHYSQWFSRLVRPLEELLTGKNRSSYRENLTFILTGGKKETKLPAFESRMIHRILHFSRAEAKNALIPLVHVDAIPETLSVGEALRAFSRTRHSRLPVYRERIDNIVGVLHVFDAFLADDASVDVTQVMQPAQYFPETQKVEDILFSMQKSGNHMGVVVDEYGGAVGILTLEDLVEEIVGDIGDEYDADSQLYRELSEGRYLIQAHMEIEAINERLKLNLPAGQYETLAGFLLQQFNCIPNEGDELYYKHLKFVVRQASDRAIRTVEATRIEE